MGSSPITRTKMESLEPQRLEGFSLYFQGFADIQSDKFLSLIDKHLYLFSLKFTNEFTNAKSTYIYVVWNMQEDQSI